MRLPATARRRGLITLLVINFMMYSGFFMVIPLVSVHYVQGLGFAAVTVGIALALRQVIQQGASLVGGVLADRFGARGLIAAGVLVRALGFLSLAWAATPPSLFLAMLLSALGGALFEAPSRAAVAALAEESERARFYSLTGVVGGMGMVVGPLIGALLLDISFPLVCIVAAICFVLISAVTLLLPPIATAPGGQRVSFGLGLALRDRTFLLFTGLLMGYWFMWVQITISLPLVGERLAGAADAVRLIYGVNAGLTVLLQMPLLGFVERRLRPLTTLILGIATMALGLGLVALAESVAALVACVVIFTLGTLLATPTQQSVTAALADERALGSYFGVSSLALAFGGGLGNFSGGLLMDVARSAGTPALPWLTFAHLGLASAVGLAILAEQIQRRSATAHLVGRHTEYSARPGRTG